MVKMGHPRQEAAWQEAFFAWRIGKPCDKAQRPEKTRALLAVREGDMCAPLPQAPYLLLSHPPLTREQWAQSAIRTSLTHLLRNSTVRCRNALL